MATIEDPLARLPNTCIDIILEQFTPMQLIGIRRVSRFWKEALDWSLAGRAKKLGQSFVKDEDNEQVASNFRRDIYRQEALKRGEPSFVRKFTNAKNGYAVCGDYFCWIDDYCLNVQHVFDPNAPGRVAHRLRRYRLVLLLEAHDVTITTIVAQEPGTITDEPLLAIGFFGPGGLTSYVAVISVKKGRMLWSTSYDLVISLRLQFALNGAALAFIGGKESSTGGKVCVRDVWTGKLRGEGGPFCRGVPSQSHTPLLLSIRAHPRRELVYVTTFHGIWFFSATTANCIGKLNIPALDNTVFQPSFHGPSDPWRLYFSESAPGHDTSFREKLVVYSKRRRVVTQWVFGHEFGIPTVEEAAAVEANLLSQGTVGKLVLEPLGVQVYPCRFTDLNPFLKISMRLHTGQPPHRRWTTRCIVEPLDGPSPPADDDPVRKSLLAKTGREHGCNTSIGIYSASAHQNTVSKPKKGVPKGTRWGEHRTECLFRGDQDSTGRIQQRYIVFPQNENVYLLGFDPSW